MWWHRKKIFHLSWSILNISCEVKRKYAMLKVWQAIPVVVRSKEWVCSSLIAGITGSNTAEGMVVCLMRLLRIV